MSQSPTSLFSRQSWISACEFHPLSPEEVLREVARRVTTTRAGDAAGHPKVLLDLDSTLYEVAPRTHQILKEWVNSEGAAFSTEIRTSLSELLTHQVGYSIRDTFLEISLDPEKNDEVRRAHDSAKKFWRQRFFTSAYLKYDLAYPGAASFVRELYNVGAELIYLTGRDEPGAGKGTRENLIRDGFPWDAPRIQLLMKDALESDDLLHKVKAARKIHDQGRLVASFENEPLNLAALHDLFPAAMHVFVDTVCSHRPAIPRKGLYRISDWNHQGRR